MVYFTFGPLSPSVHSTLVVYADGTVKRRAGFALKPDVGALQQVVLSRYNCVTFDDTEESFVIGAREDEAPGVRPHDLYSWSSIRSCGLYTELQAKYLERLIVNAHEMQEYVEVVQQVGRAHKFVEGLVYSMHELSSIGNKIFNMFLFMFSYRGLLEKTRRAPNWRYKSPFHVSDSDQMFFQYMDAGLQSGKITLNNGAERVSAFSDWLTDKEVKRREREVQQRLAAKKHAAAQEKQKPKDERAKNVLKNRDKRSPVMQGGSFLAGALTAGLTALVGGLSLKLLKRAGDTVGNVNDVLKKANTAIGDVNGILKHIRDFADSLQGKFKSTAYKVLWTIPFAVVMYYLCRYAGFPAVLTGAVFVAAGRCLPKNIWDSVRDLITPNKVELQSGVDVLSQIITTIFCVSVFKKPDQRNIGEFMKRLSILGRAKTGLCDLLDWCAKALETLINAGLWLFGKKRISLVRAASGPIGDWSRKVDELQLRTETAQFGTLNEEIDEMILLLQQGTSFKELFRNDERMRRNIESNMVKLYGMLSPYQGALNARHNLRMEPEFAILLGAPGVGKTVMSMFLCMSVMFKAGIVSSTTTMQDLKANIWQKGSGKYWNSYASPACMIMDDCFQAQGDPTDPENEFMMIIKSVSSFAYPLEFADVNSKGKNFFCSKFILATSNLPCIGDTALKFIHEPEAVARRFHHPYKVTVVPEFAKADGKLDYVKFTHELDKIRARGGGIFDFPWYIWQVQKHDFMTGCDVGDKLPMGQLVDEIGGRLRDKMVQQKDTEAVFNEFFENTKAATDLQSGRPISIFMDELVCDVSGDPVAITLGAKSPSGESKETLFFRRYLEHYESEHRKQLTNCGIALWCGVAAVLVVPVLWSVIKFICSTFVNSMHGLFNALFGGKPAKLQSNVPNKSKGKSAGTVPQSGDVNVINNVYSASYKIVIVVSDGYIPIGQIIFVNGTLAVQPEHFTSVGFKARLESGEISRNSEVKFIHATNGQHSFSMTVDRYLSYKRYSIPTMDVEFLDVEDVRAHRNIVAAFLTEHQIKHADGCVSRYEIASVSRNKSGDYVLNKETQICNKSLLKYGKAFNGRRLDRYFSQKACTQNGDCGAPLMLFDSATYGGAVVMGIHVALDRDGSALSAIVTRDMIKEAMKKLATVSDDFLADLEDRGVRLQTSDAMPFAQCGSFLPIGVLDKANVICPKSSYYPTELYGAFGDYNYRPAPLGVVYRDGVAVYPMFNAVAPYGTPLRIIEDGALEQIAYVAFKPLFFHTQVGASRIFSFEEAVLGIPESKFRSIPRKTAAGFPYCFSVKSGKTEFFGDGDNYDLSLPACVELRERVEYIISKAKQGVRLSVVFNDFLKDELRSEEKVQAVATRLISSAPLDYTIAWRMFFGHFSSQFMLHNTKIGMAPGICAYTDWEKLFEFLQSKGVDVFAGDFKGFDSSEQPSVHLVLLNVVNRWYNDGEENALVRRVLWEDLIHSRHLGGPGNDQRYIYQWNKSLPSGHPFTTIVNSMYSLLLIVACYCYATGDWSGFWSKVFAITYGDDNVVNVSSDVTHAFNQEVVARIMREKFFMHYTSDDKSSNLITVTTIDCVSFLKRRFFLDKNYVNCPLDLDSFLYTPYWCKNKRLERKIMCDCLELSLEELSLHEESVWEKHASVVYGVLSQFEQPKAPLNRSAYLRIVRSRADNWY